MALNAYNIYYLAQKKCASPASGGYPESTYMIPNTEYGQ